MIRESASPSVSELSAAGLFLLLVRSPSGDKGRGRFDPKDSEVSSEPPPTDVDDLAERGPSLQAEVTPSQPPNEFAFRFGGGSPPVDGSGVSAYHLSDGDASHSIEVAICESSLISMEGAGRVGVSFPFPLSFQERGREESGSDGRD